MSLPLTDANGVVQTKANGIPVSWNSGLGYNANGLLCMSSALSSTDTWQNGWRRDVQGRLVIGQSSPAGQPFLYNAGWPCDKVSGAIITQSGVPVSTDPRIAGVAVGPLGGVYMTEGGTIWTPLTLWPDGIDSPGMWSSPQALTASWADYTGTTPVSVPGTVADSSNPVGLALDIRAGATVLTDPGNHMLQSTSPARPLASARVNLLTYTEDFTFYQYAKNNLTTSGKVLTTTGTDNCQLGRDTGARSGGRVAFSTTVKKGKSFSFIASDAASNGCAAGFDGTTGAYFSAGSAGSTYSVAEYSCVTAADTDFWDVGVVFNTGASGASNCAVLVNTNKVTSWGWSGCSTIGDTLEIGTGFQYQLGGTVLPYQAVLGDGSTYASGFPIFKIYDGVDDGDGTAAFPEGTFVDGMDCLIAVRRDSAAACIAGLYNGIADATKFFGMAESASGSGCVGSGAGTPTVWVDNTQLTGGTAVTRGTLHTALTVGDWHILEFRNLDLSTWTAAGFGLYTGYLFNGPRGDIMLYPSTASTTDKDAARQWLADYYGVTLPAGFSSGFSAGFQK